MKNLIFLIFCAFSLFLAIYFYRQYTVTQNQLELANRRVLDRDTMIFQLQKKLQVQQGSNGLDTGAVITSKSNLGRSSSAAVQRLRSKGLKNPEADLKQSLLQNQSTVITQKGTLGGKMAIRDIQILNERYAFAYFEDGHNGGYMVLRYDLKPAGRISWVVLDSYLM